MATEQWYILKVRTEFAPAVAQKLRRLKLETIIPNPKSARPRKTYPRKLISVDYIYCRFAPKKRLDVMGIPGVVDVVRAPSTLIRA